MSKLDPRIEAVRKEYDLSADDFWQIPQNKQWVCKHAALEIVATKANVQWNEPQIIEAHTADGIAVMAVTGKMGERVEWATGEASPKNNRNAYPWAMAEKRAKDRVVLKLVGIHGLVYSEDEADDFKRPEPRTTDQRSEAGRREAANQQRMPVRLTESESATIHDQIDFDLEQARTIDALHEAWKRNWSLIQTLHPDHETALTAKKEGLKAKLPKAA